MNVQIIKKDGSPEYAIIPYNEYEHLVECAEMLEDIRDYDTVKQNIEQGIEERIPAEVVNAILDGANPIRVWRKYRNLSIAKLSKSCCATSSAISQIETGKRRPSVDMLKSIATALQVDMDLLIA